MFVYGYNAALVRAGLSELEDSLSQCDQEFCGFAFEGAAMALAITDVLYREQRFAGLMAGAGARHVYMMYVGFGWAVARLPWMRWNISRVLRQHDPVLGSLIVDGFGFHEGYFHWTSIIERCRVPAGLNARCLRLFDQGLGRSLWFFNGADAERTAGCISRFPIQRQADLWSGAGLAATYAGGASDLELAALRTLAGTCGADLAQGSAFAATARAVAGNTVTHTEAAVRILTGQPLRHVVAITHQSLASDIVQSADDRYEEWRADLRRRLCPPAGLRVASAAG